MSTHDVAALIGRRFFPNNSWRKKGGPRRFAAGLLLFLPIALALGCSGDGGDGITFVSYRDGDPEIYIMDADGSNQRPLTRNVAIDEEPRLSPDRKWVAFISEVTGNREINRVKVGEKEASPDPLTQIAGADEMHRWSPDGERIAFVSNRDGEPKIFLMNADGSHVKRVTATSSIPHLDGWSPDGQRIAFTLSGEGTEPGIITRNPDGVDVRKLTNDEDQGATWSANGEKMLYTSIRDGNQEIYIMNASGSSQERLTHNTLPDFQPVWSPDGKSIAFVSDRDGNSEIYVMKLDGGGQTRLTYNDTRDDSPVWSPDGKKIAFVSYFYVNAEIFVMDANGNSQIRLTNNDADDIQPDW